MGLGKWWLTHGPGSPGRCAKAITKSYLTIKAFHPEASRKELLLLTGMDRKRRWEMVGKCTLTDAKIAEIVESSFADLPKFVLSLVIEEDPKVEQVLSDSPDLYPDIVEVVTKTVRKYAPGE